MQKQTTILQPDHKGIAEAARRLEKGELVSFPTETVYGLGGDATNDHAVAAIFDAKQRPTFNPLIAHVPSVEAARKLTQWSELAEKVAERFWPGPLTLVLPLAEGHGLSSLVTAELPTVAVRLPAHPIAQALLKEVGRPIAAPSANPSGRISPTAVEHVMAGLNGRISAVLDGGACPVGLESTILGLAGEPSLLRAGGVPAERLEDFLGLKLRSMAPGESISAPGQLASHYAPGARVRLEASNAEAEEVLLGFGKMDCTLNLSESGDLVEAAANLFSHLHSLDALNPAGIAVAPIPNVGLGRAINDRLSRAAAPR